MANALLLGQAANLGDAQGVGVLTSARAQGENIAASQQTRQQNALNFQQQQQDRERQMATQQQEKQMQAVREDYARFMTLPDDNARTQAWQSGLAQHYGQDPNSDWHGPIEQLTKQPGFLSPELASKIMEQHFAPKPAEPFTLNAGDQRYDVHGKLIASAPVKPDATVSRLTPIPDRNSPTGFSYGVPHPGESAAPPRNAATSRLPPQIQKDEDADLEAINTASNIKADLGSLSAQIQGGSLQLGPVSNVMAGARNWAGMSDENSRNLASFKSTLEKLRNDSLRLNKGVQTEGDAVRAWNELLSNTNDSGLVLQRLDEIQRINDRAANMRQSLIENRRRSYGSQVPDTQPFENVPPAVGANKPQPAALPSGWTVRAH